VYERYGLTETLINCAVPVSQPPAARPRRPPAPRRRSPPLRRRAPPPRAPTTIKRSARSPSAAPTSSSGYLHNPAATAAVRDPDGWFYTGDLATRDAAGSLRIVGRRATDLIKSGGFKIGAGEIEACLAEHPGVLEVAVLGAPDPDLGERVVAFIVPRDLAPIHPPSPQLADHVAAALAPHKRPRAVYFLEALPRNAMGKLLKAELRARLE
jgi:malonyl-CoA/methylmalonyl-CoA synthetase